MAAWPCFLQNREYELSISIRLICMLCSGLLLTGCANLSAGNLFSHYSAQNESVYQSVKVGNYQQAVEELPEQIAGDILDNFERGRVFYLDEQYPQSKSSFELSDNAVRIEQDKAIISLSNTASSIGSLATNDNLDIYQPSDYELGFLHLYLGLNYLQKNSIEGALVEMRRANQVQENARKVREKELEAAQEQMKSQGLSPNLGSILANYPDAGKTLQAVQNGYLLYLSALLYEADGNLNDAYVDYRRALAVAPDNIAVFDGARRVARNLGMNQDLVQLEKRYGKGKPIPKGQSRVIFIEEQGIVQARQGWKQTLPIFDSRGGSAWYSIALPYYPTNVTPYPMPLQINGAKVQSSLLADVNLMAKNDLSEKMPSLILRQALRVVAKEQLRREATNGDDVGNLIFNVWNTLTEQPDTRSWQTLPASIYSASQLVVAGEQQVVLDGQSYTFSVKEGQTALVWLSRQGSHATIWHKQLGTL